MKGGEKEDSCTHIKGKDSRLGRSDVTTEKIEKLLQMKEQTQTHEGPQVLRNSGISHTFSLVAEDPASDSSTATPNDDHDARRATAVAARRHR